MLGFLTEPYLHVVHERGRGSLYDLMHHMHDRAKAVVVENPAAVDHASRQSVDVVFSGWTTCTDPKTARQCEHRTRALRCSHRHPVPPTLAHAHA